MSLQTTLVSVSKKYSLTIRDLSQGAIMAAIGAVGGQLYSVGAQWMTSDTFTGIDKHSLMLAAKGAIFAAAVYLAKRFINGRQIIISNVPKDTAEAVKAGAPVQVSGETIAVKTPAIPPIN